MKIKHIYFFASYNINGVSTRYRGVYVLNKIYEKHKITSSFIYPGYKFSEVLHFCIAFLKVLLSFQSNIVVIFQKTYSKGIYTKLLKLLVKLKPNGTIYDTDDADYLRYYKDNIYFFMENCQMCTVGSEALRKFTCIRNKKVLVITSPVIKHDEIKQGRNKILHIGWVGDYGLNNGFTPSFSHKVSLNRLLFPILQELDFTFKLTILGIKNPEDKTEIENYFLDNKNIILEIPMKINWLDEISIYRRIKKIDIGVSPMVNDEFNVAKSAFKIKQYLSCGVPVLASPIGENLTFVNNGENGFFCRSTLEFKERIIQINKMTKEEYNQFHLNALKTIDDFSMDYYCNSLLNGISENNLLN